MRKHRRWNIRAVGILSLLLAAMLPRVQAGPPAHAGPRPIGTVQAVDVAGRRITMKTDAGVPLTVVLDDSTRIVRVKPGMKTLRGAPSVPLAEVRAGDRMLARGRLSGDRHRLAASLVILMSKADIAAQHAAERALWDQKGVGGIITAIHPATKEIVIKQGGIAGPRKLVIRLAPQARLRRYAPDSIRFQDAKASRFEELKVGDQVMALGELSPDGSFYTARELVSGSFQNIPAQVKSVDAAAGTLRVRNLITGKRLLVRVKPDSTLRRLPPRMARFMAMLVMAGRRGSRRTRNGGRRRPMGSPRMRPGAGPGRRVRRPGMAGGRRPNLQELIRRLPPLKVAELKPGEEIIIAGTKGAEPGKITAITLLAGVEPIIEAASRGGGRSMQGGSWNLNVNMNMGMQ